MSKKVVLAHEKCDAKSQYETTQMHIRFEEIQQVIKDFIKNYPDEKIKDEFSLYLMQYAMNILDDIDYTEALVRQLINTNRKNYVKER